MYFVTQHSPSVSFVLSDVSVSTCPPSPPWAGAPVRGCHRQAFGASLRSPPHSLVIARTSDGRLAISSPSVVLSPNLGGCSLPRGKNPPSFASLNRRACPLSPARRYNGYLGRGGFLPLTAPLPQSQNPVDKST